MIRIQADKRNGSLYKISIKGHAGANADTVYDMVCAGVSAASIGAANAMDELAKDVCEFSGTDNPFFIEMKKDDETARIILNTLLIQLQSLQEAYPDNIKIQYR